MCLSIRALAVRQLLYCPSLGPAPGRPRVPQVTGKERSMRPSRTSSFRSISRPTSPASSAARSAIPVKSSTGFPLWSASVDGEAVKLELKTAGPGVQTFDGRLSADGQTITGQFLIDVSRRAVHTEAQRRGADRAAAAQRRDRRQARGVVGRGARGRRPVIAARADADESCRPNRDGDVGHGWRLADSCRHRSPTTAR